MEVAGNEDDGDLAALPMLIVRSKHEVKPESARFYVIDADGDICGLSDEQMDGFEVLYFATALAKEIERNFTVSVNVAQVTETVDGSIVKYGWKTVWRLGDPRPARGGSKKKRSVAAGSTHSDFGSW